MQYVRNRPIILAHTINSECNLRCPFCPFWRRKRDEMSKEEIFKFLRKCKELGVLIYNVWATEPLLRQDLAECLRYARFLGMKTFVITNGTLLKDKIEVLKYCDYLAVSIDGIKTYSELRGYRLEDVIEGIVKARNAGIKTSINCILNNKNLDEVVELVSLAEGIGVGILFEPIHEYENISKDVWDEFGIRDTRKYKEAVDKIIEMKRRGKPVLNSYSYLKMIRELKPDFKCKVNEVIIHLSSDGKIESCFGVVGSVDDDLAKLWSSWKNKTKKLVEGCEGCLFSGYVEISLLFSFNVEVMLNYMKYL
ncbi:pyrroloquinoline quinone biosynthesis protein PqqE [Archaeoglobales archaeon]|nr:MAG: pyrroloquinoline quinone biosynthesis protein PqqE [Archaeoglobales archaeon]